MGKLTIMQGNAAMTEGAIAAGARFYAGYPITPSSEVAETSAARLPQVGGVFIQMEDELGSMGALIGASCAGKKAYTATSGPGFSLMQENIGTAAMGEVPCVVINVQRSGPATGLATKPAQGDVYQARYGTHGDHSIIAISPSSVQDCFDLMITAFNYSEEYRTPVIFLADEIIGHLREQVVIREPGEYTVVERKAPTCDPEDYKPYDHSNGLAPMGTFGTPYRLHVSGTTHDETGRTNVKPENADKLLRHLTNKIEDHKDEICITRKYNMDDAEYVIVCYGGVARASLEAMKKGREKGLKIGVLQIVTVWPVPEKEIAAAIKQAKAVFVPEMNLGQYIHEVARLNADNTPIIGINKIDSMPILPKEILAKVEEVAK